MSDHYSSDHHGEGNGQVLTEPDRTPSKLLATVVGVGGFTVLVSMIAINGLYTQFDRHVVDTKHAPGYGEIAHGVFEQQETQLAAYRVVDAERKVYAIPIDVASGLVLKELAANPEADVTGPPPPPPKKEAPPADGTPPSTSATPSAGSEAQPNVAPATNP
ncbi:MAG: hypothetical protein K1X74_05820 [Pirellulales bacterium]|nr:hypothetical protein [Pirellulales bacterium]